ncbi:MAG: Na+/H+ antiporter NhaA [Bacteroidia bacterium]
MRFTIITRRLIIPLYRFMQRSSASGLVLFVATLIALVVANSPLKEIFNAFWQTKFVIGFGSFWLEKPLLLWVNDGLMSMFFFVVGLELKREIWAGELRSPQRMVWPLVAGIGGMAVPAFIYLLINKDATEAAQAGWGIPMATDIAFTLGVLYMLGNRVPISLKVFITALAIIDDLGAVSVIAFFYTSDISLANLGLGALFLLAMISGNLLGVRNTLFYTLIGIGGLWLAFLLSGVHATIAAVLAAFTIPARGTVPRKDYVARLQTLVRRLAHTQGKPSPFVTHEQEALLLKIERNTEHTFPPLQKLEHSMHPLVAFIVVPVFALANAGVDLFDTSLDSLFGSVSIGIMAGLVIGKVVGIVGFTWVFEKLGVLRMPVEINYPVLFGAAFLAAIGFTMSLFITNLAFTDEALIYQAKLGILLASLLAGLVGYWLLRKYLPFRN